MTIAAARAATCINNNDLALAGAIIIIAAAEA
jgi:hypothetical protein